MLEILPAASSRIDSSGLKPFVNELLKFVAEIKDEPGIARAFVSDDSILWDFGPFNVEEIEVLSERLGFNATISEYVWKIAKKLKEQRQPQNS